MIHPYQKTIINCDDKYGLRTNLILYTDFNISGSIMIHPYQKTIINCDDKYGLSTNLILSWSISDPTLISALSISPDFLQRREHRGWMLTNN